jgi:hypothetical protein
MYILLLIGELGKLEMLHEGILHKCIKQLLEKKKNVPIRDMAEDLECLCQIMRTVGRRLDTPKAKVGFLLFVIFCKCNNRFIFLFHSQWYKDFSFFIENFVLQFKKSLSITYGSRSVIFSPWTLEVFSYT